MSSKDGKFAIPTVNVTLGDFGQSYTEEYWRRMRDMAFSTYTIAAKAPAPTDPLTEARERADSLQRQLTQYVEQMQQLQAKPCLLATVQRIGKKVTIVVAGKDVEVERPKDMKLKPGMKVRVTDTTMQILGPVEDDSPTGEVVDVVRVSRAGTLEVERNGSPRAVSCDPDTKYEAGDRVVLDATGTVATANLGRAGSGMALGEATGVTWDDIGGLEEAKRQLREAVESPTTHRDMFHRYGKRPSKGVLLHGPAGCGKTLCGKAAATALAAVHGQSATGAFFYVKGPELLNMYVGNTEAQIRRLFDDARRHKRQHGFPAVIFIDEADAILGKRGAFGFGLEKTIVPQFLAEMDGLEDTGALVLLATNMPRTLDPAIVRDGRMDRKIRIGRPTRDDAIDILGKHLRNKPIAGDALHEELIGAATDAVFDKRHVLLYVKKTDTVKNGVPMTLGHCVSGALLAGVVDRATSFALHRELSGGDPGLMTDDLDRAAEQAAAEMREVNLDEELIEFTEGWRHEVTGVTSANASHRVRTVAAPGAGSN